MKSTQYQVGNFKFVPQRRLLICNKTQSKQTLDGKQTAILCFFMDNPHQLISRDALISHVWQRSHVADHTINTKISELRKLLGDDYRNPNYVKTHHQRGYEFLAPVSIAPTLTEQLDPSPKPPIQTHKSSAPLTGTIVCVITVLCIFVLSINYLTSPFIESGERDTYNYQLIPVTTERGQESQPAVSPDGQLLAYSHRTQVSDSWQIKIKHLNNHQVINISQGLFNANTPIWGNDSSSLYYIRSIDGKCDIWQSGWTYSVDNINNITNKHITECGSHNDKSSLALSKDGQWLYYTKFYPNLSANIHRINLELNIIEILTEATVSDNFNHLALSNDNTKLAYIHTNVTNHSDIVVQDLTNRAINFRSSLVHKPSFISWNTTDTGLYYININNQLTTVDINTNRSQVIAQFSQPFSYPYFHQSNEFYLVDGDFFSSEIVSLPLNPQQQHVTVTPEIYSSYKDFDASFHPNKQMIAFTSDRNKHQQIWIKYNNQQFNITHFTQFGHISNKQFSPDGSSLIFLRNQQAYIVNLASQETQQILQHQSSMGSPIWSCDGQSILYTSLLNNNWALFSLDIKSMQSKHLVDNILLVKSDCSQNRYYTINPNSTNIVGHPLDFTKAYSVIPPLLTSQTSDWVISDNILYQLVDYKLSITDLTTQQNRVITLPFSYYSTPNILNNRIYLTRKIFQETKIKQLLK